MFCRKRKQARKAEGSQTRKAEKGAGGIHLLRLRHVLILLDGVSGVGCNLDHRRLHRCDRVCSRYERRSEQAEAGNSNRTDIKRSVSRSQLRFL